MEVNGMHAKFVELLTEISQKHFARVIEMLDIFFTFYRVNLELKLYMPPFQNEYKKNLISMIDNYSSIFQRDQSRFWKEDFLFKKFFEKAGLLFKKLNEIYTSPDYLMIKDGFSDFIYKAFLVDIATSALLDYIYDTKQRCAEGTIFSLSEFCLLDYLFYGTQIARTNSWEVLGELSVDSIKDLYNARSFQETNKEADFDQYESDLTIRLLDLSDVADKFIIKMADSSLSIVSESDFSFLFAEELFAQGNNVCINDRVTCFLTTNISPNV